MLTDQRSKPGISNSEGSEMRSLLREKFFLHLLAACLLLSLGYIASRTLPVTVQVAVDITAENAESAEKLKEKLCQAGQNIEK